MTVYLLYSVKLASWICTNIYAETVYYLNLLLKAYSKVIIHYTVILISIATAIAIIKQW